MGLTKLKGERGKLTFNKPFTGRATITQFLRSQLKELFPEVELIANRKGQVELWRVLQHGASRSSDIIVKEFTLKEEPGNWLIKHLMDNDIFRQIKLTNNLSDNTDKLLNFANKQEKLQEKRTKILSDARENAERQFVKWAKNPVSINLKDYANV